MTVASNTQPEPEVWAIVELMGHVRMAGRLTEEERFGAKMGRLDIPTLPDHPREDCLYCKGHGVLDGQPCPMPECGPQYVTQFFGGASVYRITVVTEPVARIVAAKSFSAPVHSWDLPKKITQATSRDLDDFDGNDDDQ